MTTLPLLHHEIAALPRLRAVWRPVKHINSPDGNGREFIFRDGIVWASLKPEELAPLDENPPRSIFGARAIFDGERAYTPIVIGGGDGKHLRCPLGAPGDELICRWKTTRRVVSVPLGGPDDVSEVRQTRGFHITSVAVRRVAEMKEDEAGDWGCYAANLSGFTAANRSRSTTAAEMACDVWRTNWPAAEWAWVMGVTQEEARCQSTK
jgi:hypothetical protein